MALFRRKKTKAKKSSRRKVKTKKVTKKRKKTVRKRPVKARAAKGKEVLIGVVSHYFPHVKAGAILIKKGAIAVGDTLHIKGHTTDFKQKVGSLQIDRNPVEKAFKGAEIGILVKSRVRINDKVYKTAP